MSKQVLQYIKLLIILLASSIGVNGELKLVVEIFRHGARAPLKDWYDALEQSQMQGELSATGQRQNYNLGALLREEYKEFLPSVFNHSQIYVRSSDSNRTLMSASSQLQGMFPQGTGVQIATNLTENYTLPAFQNARTFLKDTYYALPNNIQVIPIHSEKQQGDLVLLPKQNCQKFNQLKNSYLEEMKETVQFIMKQFESTFSFYSAFMNRTIKTIEKFQNAESTLVCDRYNGRPVPEFPPEIQANASYLFSLSQAFSYTKLNFTNALNTPFLHQLLDYMNPIVQDKQVDKLKWVMLSAHDFNIQAISTGLNFTSLDCLLAERFAEYRHDKGQSYYNCEYYPQFTSTIIFELHQANNQSHENGVEIITGQYYIRIRRDGKYMKLCQNNATLCSFQDFWQRIQWSSIDFYSVCGDPKTSIQKSKEIIQESQDDEECYFKGRVYYISGLVIQLLIILILSFFILKKQCNNEPIHNFEVIKEDQQSNFELATFN